MKSISPFALLLVVLILSFPVQSRAQSADADKAVRPRTVAAATAQQTATPAKQAEVAPIQTPGSSAAPSGTTQPAIAPSLPYAPPPTQGAAPSTTPAGTTLPATAPTTPVTATP